MIFLCQKDVNHICIYPISFKSRHIFQRPAAELLHDRWLLVERPQHSRYKHFNTQLSITDATGGVTYAWLSADHVMSWAYHSNQCNWANGMIKAVVNVV